MRRLLIEIDNSHFFEKQDGRNELYGGTAKLDNEVDLPKTVENFREYRLCTCVILHSLNQLNPKKRYFFFPIFDLPLVVIIVIKIYIFLF